MIFGNGAVIGMVAYVEKGFAQVKETSYDTIFE